MGVARARPARLRVLCTPRSAARARHWVLDRIGAAGLECDRDTLELLVSELVANALRHGSRWHPVSVALYLGGDRIRVEVRNHARHRSGLRIRTRRSCPGGSAESGRGLFLVQELAEHWDLSQRRSHTVVSFAIKATSGAGTARSVSTFLRRRNSPVPADVDTACPRNVQVGGGPRRVPETALQST